MLNSFNIIIIITKNCQKTSKLNSRKLWTLGDNGVLQFKFIHWNKFITLVGHVDKESFAWVGAEVT